MLATVNRRGTHVTFDRFLAAGSVRADLSTTHRCVSNTPYSNRVVSVDSCSGSQVTHPRADLPEASVQGEEVGGNPLLGVGNPKFGRTLVCHRQESTNPTRDCVLGHLRIRQCPKLFQ